MRRHFQLTRFAMAAFACVIVLTASVGWAKDLGVRGAVWPVEEPDLLTQIEERLEAMKTSGELARANRQAVERARARIEAPERVPDIQPARERRTRMFDPSVTIERDIFAHDGRLLAALETRINPLEKHPLTRDLLFIDGTRPVEVDWAIAREKPSVIVLLAGRPLELMRAHGRAFFFDQGGRLARRFRLRVTPSLINVEGLSLRITEVPLEDEENAGSEGDRS